MNIEIDEEQLRDIRRVSLNMDKVLENEPQSIQISCILSLFMTYSALLPPKSFIGLINSLKQVYEDRHGINFEDDLDE